MLSVPEEIVGKVAIDEFLARIAANTELIRLAEDYFCREHTERLICRKYLETTTGNIFLLKGSTQEEGRLLWSKIRDVTTAEGNGKLVKSEVFVRYFKPPLVGKLLIKAILIPKAKAGNASRPQLTIDWSACNYRVSKNLNDQLIRSIVQSSFCRAIAKPISDYEEITICIEEIMVHEIDTGMNLLDYLSIKSIDQLFQSEDAQPHASLKNGKVVSSFRPIHSFLKFDLAIVT